MATSNTNRTIWTLALVGIAVFLAWKLWPALKNALNKGSGGSGSGGGAVGGASNPYPFYENPYGSGGGSGGGASFPNFGSGGGAGAGGTESQVTDPLGALWNWISGQETAQGSNALYNQDAQLGYNPSNGTDELAQLDQMGLATSAYQNFDVNELATSATTTSAYDPYADTISIIPGGYADYTTSAPISDSSGDTFAAGTDTGQNYGGY